MKKEKMCLCMQLLKRRDRFIANIISFYNIMNTCIGNNIQNVYNFEQK